MSGFYQNWLKMAIWGVIAFGVILALFAFPATELPSRLFYDLIQNPVDAEADRHFRFAMGLMGCITVGWGLSMFTILKAASMLEGAQAAAVWRSFAFAVLIWYVIDNIASIYTGFPLNALSNSVLLAMFLIPLWKSGVLKGASQ